jgi:hypothetical protein
VKKSSGDKDVLFETFIDRTKVTFMLKEGKSEIPGDHGLTGKHTRETHRKHTENGAFHAGFIEDKRRNLPRSVIE